MSDLRCNTQLVQSSRSWALSVSLLSLNLRAALQPSISASFLHDYTNQPSHQSYFVLVTSSPLPQSSRDRPLSFQSSLHSPALDTLAHQIRCTDLQKLASRLRNTIPRRPTTFIDDEFVSKKFEGAARLVVRASISSTKTKTVTLEQRRPSQLTEHTLLRHN